jgi:hypothetical protein
LYDEEGFGEFRHLRYLTGKRSNIYDWKVYPEDLVGINEVMLSAVINRCLKIVYDFQQQLLASTQTEYMNFYPLSAEPIILHGVTDRVGPLPPPEMVVGDPSTGITGGLPPAPHTPVFTPPVTVAPPVPEAEPYVPPSEPRSVAGNPPTPSGY